MTSLMCYLKLCLLITRVTQALVHPLTMNPLFLPQSLDFEVGQTSHIVVDMFEVRCEMYATKITL